jgi:hypothetical protein
MRTRKDLARLFQYEIHGRFNGTAAQRPRKAVELMVADWLAGLQWGRGGETAESGLAAGKAFGALRGDGVCFLFWSARLCNSDVKPIAVLRGSYPPKTKNQA